MKRILTMTVLFVTLYGAGCAKPNQPAPPLAPGYSNQADQTMGEALAAAHGFYQRMQSDAAAGTFKPTVGESKALDELGTAINIAQPLYLAFHAGTGSQQAAQSAVDQVTLKQAAVQAMGVK
jgi:hypothetical protein